MLGKLRACWVTVLNHFELGGGVAVERKGCGG